MSERKLYQKFKEKMLKTDPNCWIYKIPDTFNLGGKKHAKTILSFLSKISDAEMPQRRKLRDTSSSYVTDLGEMRDNAHRDGVIEGYNQCHDDFLAYHLRKMGERVNVERIIKCEHPYKKYEQYCRICKQEIPNWRNNIKPKPSPNLTPNRKGRKWIHFI